jgi:hypothetical protein
LICEEEKGFAEASNKSLRGRKNEKPISTIALIGFYFIWLKPSQPLSVLSYFYSRKKEGGKMIF